MHVVHKYFLILNTEKNRKMYKKWWILISKFSSPLNELENLDFKSGIYSVSENKVFKERRLQVRKRKRQLE